MPCRMNHHQVENDSCIYPLMAWSIWMIRMTTSHSKFSFPMDFSPSKQSHHQSVRTLKLNKHAHLPIQFCLAQFILMSLSIVIHSQSLHIFIHKPFLTVYIIFFALLEYQQVHNLKVLQSKL